MVGRIRPVAMFDVRPESIDKLDRQRADPSASDPSRQCHVSLTLQIEYARRGMDLAECCGRVELGSHMKKDQPGKEQSLHNIDQRRPANFSALSLKEIRRLLGWELRGDRASCHPSDDKRDSSTERFRV